MALQEKQAVWFDNRQRRGIIVALSAGGSALLLTSEGATAEVSLTACEPLSENVCFLCGVVEEVSPEQRKAMEDRTRELWGEVPPPERRIAMCDVCAHVVHLKEQKELRGSGVCTCAFARGKSVRCLCEWRRAKEQL